jgi:hypothetical protein
MQHRNAARLHWSMMVMIPSTPQHTGMQEPATGMGRFFSPRNLGRYRKLAGGGLGEEEQRQLLKDLAEEMDEFRRETHRTAFK